MSYLVLRPWLWHAPIMRCMVCFTQAFYNELEILGREIEGTAHFKINLNGKGVFRL
jgi:hypothetical protein